MSEPRALRIFIVAGEHSGDQLGAKLMAALRTRHAGPIRFGGVGDRHMAAEGLDTLYPLDEVAVMGPLAILRALPRLRRRVLQTVAAAIGFHPDLLVIVDAPEFTHPIAKRVRRRRPDIPIVDYVSPSVWAWRPGRAQKMRPYVDHLLALLPFEPEVHARLGGPPCTYVGHPLSERLGEWRSVDPEPLARRLALDPQRPVLVVLPGSRASVIARLIEPFGEAVHRLDERGPPPQVIMPTMPHVRALIGQLTAAWAVRPHMIEDEADKIAAFRLARAALAASGTVTLELAVAGTPTVVAYRVDGMARHLRFMVKVPSIVLANLVAGENIYPELIQEDCTGERLAAELAAVMAPGPVRDRQLQGLARLPERLAIEHSSPADKAADVVLELLRQRRRR